MEIDEVTSCDHLLVVLADCFQSVQEKKRIKKKEKKKNVRRGASLECSTQPGGFFRYQKHWQRGNNRRKRCLQK